VKIVAALIDFHQISPPHILVFFIWLKFNKGRSQQDAESLPSTRVKRKIWIANGIDEFFFEPFPAAALQVMDKFRSATIQGSMRIAPSLYGKYLIV